MNLPSVAAPSPLSGRPLAHFSPIGIRNGAGSTPAQKFELRDHWRSLLKRKWVVLGVALGAAALSCVVAWSMTPVYRSTATLWIETGPGKILSIPDVYTAAAAVGSQQREYYQTQVEIVKSRDVADRTVRALKLWEVPEFDPRLGLSARLGHLLGAIGIHTAANQKVWTDDRLAAACTVEFLKAFEVEPVRMSQLVKLNFESRDMDLAARVANTAAEQYIGADRAGHLKVSQEASSVLQERLKSLRDKLTQSELALQEYRDRHGMVNLSGSAQAPAGQQVSATTDRLVSARTRRAELESSYLQLRSVRNGDYSSSPIVMRDPAVMDTVRQLEDVNRRLAELSETLGPRNLRILELESQKAQVAAALSRQRTLVARSITREYEAALATEQSIQRELNAARTGVQMVNREEFQLASLEREAQTNRQLYDLFMSRAKETDLAGSVQASVARVVDPAVPDELAYRPARLEIVLATTLLALLAAAGASFVLDRLDKSVKGGEDAEFRLDQPVLAALPEVHGSDRRRMALLFLQDTHSHFAEAIRTLRTGVLMSSADHPHKMILVTSSLPGEGKTTVAINLALAHAQTKRTLLIDADMRRSQVDRSLRIAPGHRGLTNLVAGTANIDACVQQFTGTDLHVMSIGELPPNPLELLLSERFGEVLQELSDQFEVIIIDSPPVEMVSEALVLAPLVTSTVFVVKALSTPAALARKSLDRLQRAGGSILGLVVNQLDFGGAPRDYGEYGLYGEAAQSYLDHQEGEGGVVAARS